MRVALHVLRPLTQLFCDDQLKSFFYLSVCSRMASRAVRNRNVVVAYWYLRRLQRRREFWVHPFIRENQSRSAFALARELEKDEEKFKGFYRMSRELFKELVGKLSPVIRKKDTNRRRCISVEERLLITLR